MVYQKISKSASSNAQSPEKSASIVPQSVPFSLTPIAHFHEFTQVPVYSPTIQAKLTIGLPNDRYEQEADRVAAQVVQQLQRPASIQRQDELNETIQAKSMLQRPDAIVTGEASTQLASEIDRHRGGGQSLDVGLQKSMGQAMGADFRRVRVHTDGQSDQLNRSIKAEAFTTGQDMFFRQGSYQPSSRNGQELIAHELTHVVQQNFGTVRRYSLGGEDVSVELENAKSSSAHGSADLIQRKLHNSLKGRDAQNRLETLLTKEAGGFGKPPIRELYDKILDSEKEYTWEMIENEFSSQFIQNLNGYVPTGSQQVSLYRADGRSPKKLKESNPPGFGMRSSVPFSLLKAALLKDPSAFAEDHVRLNRQDLKSYATDVGVGGFASADRYLYEIDFGSWSVFKRPEKKGSLSSAVILANASNLDSATKIAIDTLKPTKEIFLLFELGLTDITSVRAPGANALTGIDWNS